MSNGIAGMMAEPNCKRHDRAPVPATARLAHVARRIPNAVHSCQDMTNPPRMFLGATSAENTGTVTSFSPIPRPRSIRQATSWPHVCEQAIPMGANTPKIAPMKIVNLLPTRWLRGSDSQAALNQLIDIDLPRVSGGRLPLTGTQSQCMDLR